MDGITIGKFLLAGMLAFFVIRGVPAAIHHIKHGPKGSTSEWLNAALLLGAVVLFVLFLMSIT